MAAPAAATTPAEKLRADLRDNMQTLERLYDALADAQAREDFNAMASVWQRFNSVLDERNKLRARP
jgi:hypothetical protein